MPSVPSLEGSMSRRIRRVVLAGLAVVSFVAFGVSSAGASVADPISTTNWQSGPSGGCPVLSLIIGDCSLPPDAFTAGSGGSTLDPVDGSVIEKLQEAAEVIPRPATIGPLQEIVLGVAAFQIGVEIGSTINHKWLHLAGIGLGDTLGVSTQGGTQSPSAFKWVYTTAAKTCGTGCTYANPAGWVLEYYTAYTNAWDDVYYPGCYGDTACGAEYWSDQGMEAVYTKTIGAAVYQQQGCPGCVLDGHTPAILEIPTPNMGDALLQDKPLQPYTGQTHSVSIGWANPTTGAGVTAPAPGFNAGPTDPQPCVTYSSTLTCLNGGSPSQNYTVSPQPTNGDPGFDDAVTNAIRHYIDPVYWAEPQKSPDGTYWATTGGPDITMPDCRGLAVANCSTAVDNALEAAGATSGAGYSVEVSATYDPTLPDGVVVSTTPTAGTFTDATAVTMETNESQSYQWCRAKADNYHLSGHTGKMLAISYLARCDFSSPPLVSLSGIGYACTSKPQKDLVQLESGAWGCVPEAENFDQLVTAVFESRSPDNVYANGPTYDPTKWYIAVAFSSQPSPVVEVGYSQIDPPGTYGT